MGISEHSYQWTVWTNSNMNIDYIKQVVNRISYKPNVRFIISRTSDGYYIRMSTIRQDIRNPVEETELMISQLIEAMDEKGVVAAVNKIVRRFEEHEINEWLKIDGLRLINPHLECNPNEKLYE